MKNEKKVFRRLFGAKNVATFLLLLLANVLMVLTLWLSTDFADMDMTALLFQINSPIEGVETTNLAGVIRCSMIGFPVLFALELGILALVRWLGRLCAKKGKNIGAKLFGTWWRFRVIYGVVVLVIGFLLLANQVEFFPYIAAQLDRSTIYEEHYVDPEGAVITFPEEKRNLIYIYLESLENSYADVEHGGVYGENLIPELTELQQEHVAFVKPGQATLGGATPIEGTNWTVASLVAQTSGVPLTIPIGRNAMGDGYTTFLPGVFTLGEVLEREGYRQRYLIGSEVSFGGTEVYLTTHGGYELRDHKYYSENGTLPEGYYVWWGYEDKRLYEYAREELTELSAGGEPFAFTMMTIDTHCTGGYVCELCEDTYDDQYANVIRCACKQLTAFLAWLEEQPYYENTTIVIAGDHPVMHSAYIKALPGYEEGYVRKNYTVVINSAVPYELDMTREFTPMDMYPTTLVAMGATIEGNRLGLGTNLFSQEPTLLEMYGWETLNKELTKHSEYYDERLLFEE